MTDERSYVEGNRRAWLTVLGTCLRELGDDAPESARLTLERQEAVAQLRELCERFGDNDWPDDLHLADVIDKHLGRHLMKDAKWR